MDLMTWLLMRDTRVLAERINASDAIRRRARDNQGEVIRDLAAEIDWLRRLTVSLAELCLTKGLVTEDELRARLQEVERSEADAQRAAVQAPATARTARSIAADPAAKSYFRGGKRRRL